MRKCGNCGASIVGNAGTCGYCTVNYNSTENATRTPMKSEEAMRLERDSQMYLKAARYCAYTVGISLMLVVVIIVATGKSGKDSFFMDIVQVVSSISMYAGIIFFIIGKVKKKKAEGMK